MRKQSREKVVVSVLGCAAGAVFIVAMGQVGVPLFVYKILLAGIFAAIMTILVYKALFASRKETPDSLELNTTELEELQELYERIHSYLHSEELKEKFSKFTSRKVSPERVYYWLVSQESIIQGPEFDSILAEFMLYHDSSSDPIPSAEIIEDSIKYPCGFAYYTEKVKSSSGEKSEVKGSWKINSNGRICGIFIPFKIEISSLSRQAGMEHDESNK